jgi:hypothetical protein
VETARDGIEVDVMTLRDHWRCTWYPPSELPAGTRHGSTGVCVSDGQVILVSDDGQQWQLPGGRPEPGEDWIDT